MNMAIAGAAISGVSYGAQVCSAGILFLDAILMALTLSQPLAFAIPSEVVHRKYRVHANLFANVVSLFRDRGEGSADRLLKGWRHWFSHRSGDR